MTLFILAISIAFMIFYGASSKEALMASFFLIFLESITAFNNLYGLYHFNHLMLFYFAISIIFGFVALKSSFLSDIAYIVYALSYISMFADDTLYEFGYILNQGFLYNNYEIVLYGCLLILVFTVTHDRMAIEKPRASVFVR